MSNDEDFNSINDKVQKYKCEVCCKSFTRKYNLDRHVKTSCHKEKEEKDIINYRCEHCNTVFVRKWSRGRHLIICNKNESLEMKMIKEKEDYTEKYLKGKRIFEILNKNNNIKEQAISDDKKEALKIYIHDTSINLSGNITLLLWQSQLMRYFDDPSYRKVIWIIGRKGNEGKSFFQNYVEKFFGIRRVMCTNLNTKSANINLILASQSLTCKDIFLFNIPRYAKIYELAYDSIEGIKDGVLSSTKYYSKTLKVKSPNTVMVFSNTSPDYKKLSYDRWIILEIKDGILKELKTDNTFV